MLVELSKVLAGLSPNLAPKTAAFCGHVVKELLVVPTKKTLPNWSFLDYTGKVMGYRVI